MTTALPKSAHLAAAALGGALALTGCGDGGSGSATGALTVGVTDAPIDRADAVTVEFTGITVKPAEGEPQLIELPDDNDDGEPDPETVTLTDLTGENRAVLLEEVTVPAGDYAWIRLHVEAKKGVLDSTITLEDGSGPYSLYVPSGAESGLKLVGGLSVPEDGNQDVTVDFDLRKSVHKPEIGTDYYLRPTLRLVDTSEIGVLKGTIGDQFLTNNSCDPATDDAAVYVFDGDVTPDDYTSPQTDNQDVDPITTAQPEDDAGTWKYTVGYLLAGTYTVSFTCQAGQDQNDSNDYIAGDPDNSVMTFVGTGTRDIPTGGEATYDFTASGTQ